MNFLDKVGPVADYKHFYCEITGVTPITWNRQIPEDVIKEKKRTAEQVERELWREKLHYRQDVGLFHVADGLVKMLSGGAKSWGASIPGKGKQKYSSQLNAAITLASDVVIMSKDGKKLTPESSQVTGYERYVTKDTGRQVFIITPMVYEWTGRFALTVHNPDFKGVVLAEIVKYAGLYCGLGAWWTKYGRFEPTLFEDGGPEVHSRIADFS
jgi:hypothetical protein